MQIEAFTEKWLEECTDLFIDTFSRPPWLETYRSREQVLHFLQRFLQNREFLGFLYRENGRVAALCIGMKKPWLEGVEYYIDQFCVRPDLQRRGIGSRFLQQVEQELRRQGLNGMMLNTERGFPSEAFYRKNGFHALEQAVLFVK